MYSIVYQPRAIKEINHASRWYEEQQIGLGERFLSEMRKRVEIIRKQPDRYAVKERNNREVKIQDFPYLIIYKIDEPNSRIIIRSIFHVKRNPASKY